MTSQSISVAAPQRNNTRFCGWGFSRCRFEGRQRVTTSTWPCGWHHERHGCLCRTSNRFGFRFPFALLFGRFYVWLFARRRSVPASTCKHHSIMRGTSVENLVIISSAAPQLRAHEFHPGVFLVGRWRSVGASVPQHGSASSCCATSSRQMTSPVVAWAEHAKQKQICLLHAAFHWRAHDS
jgi:hypothetical protein